MGYGTHVCINEEDDDTRSKHTACRKPACSGNWMNRSTLINVPEVGTENLGPFVVLLRHLPRAVERKRLPMLSKLGCELCSVFLTAVLPHVCIPDFCQPSHSKLKENKQRLPGAVNRMTLQSQKWLSDASHCMQDSGSVANQGCMDLGQRVPTVRQSTMPAS